MKKFRKLIPALAMLLVSATVLASSTFAWFSMNKTVTATGMQITANSDSVYLLISNTAESTTAEAIQAENLNKGFTSVSATLSGEQVNVLPSALATAASKSGVHKDTITDYSDPASWYKSFAADAGSYESVQASESALTEEIFNKYVIKYTYRFTLAKGSNNAINLKVKNIVITPNTTANGSATIKPVSVLVVNRADQTKSQEFKVEDQTLTDGKYTIDGSTALADSVTDATVVTLDVYVYYDGNNAAVYTNNKANLNGCSFEINFEVSPA